MSARYLTFLLLLAGAFLDLHRAVAAPIGDDAELKALRQKAADRPRRLIYNNDGNEPNSMRDFSIPAFLAKRTDRLAGTQVDAIFYCTGPGFGLFTHDTKAGLLFTTHEGRYADNVVEEFLKTGSDPLKEIVKFGHGNGMEVFWSMRMNDTHDGSMKEYGPDLFAANRWKVEHPEWLLGSEQNPPFHGKWSGVNYEVPEIREKAFNIVEEVCQRYDVDGVELDFFRHPTFFKYAAKSEPATDAQRELMTDLMRRIRAMTEVEGKKRGRPILLAIKAPDSVEYCRAVGIDLEKWFADGLIDLFIPSSYFQLNPWEYSVALAHKYGVKVYPSLDDVRNDDREGQKLREGARGYRGRAMEVWSSGADGVYLYNFFKKDTPYEILKEAGDPAILATKDRDYFGSALGRSHVAGGGFPHAAFQKIEILNPEDAKKVAPGETAEAKFDLPEDLAKNSPKALELRLRFDPDGAQKAIKVQLNGRELAPGRVAARWLEFELTTADVRQGENVVQVSLAGTEKRAVRWEDLDFQVRP